MSTSLVESSCSPDPDPFSDAMAYILAGGLPSKGPVVRENLRPVDLVRKVLDFYPRVMEYLDNGEKQPEPDSSPITKYDRHVHEKLLLKRVEKLPSLIPSIMQHADTMVDSFLDDVEALSADRLLDPWDLSGHVSSAESVAMRRSSLVHPATRLASIIALHPELPEIPPLLRMIPDTQQSKNVSPFFSQCLSIELSDMRGADRQASIASLPNHRKSLINRLSERSVPLLVWDTFALNGKATLEDMDRIAGVPFPWKLYSTVGHPRRLFREPAAVDAPKRLWTLPRAKWSQTREFLNAYDLEGQKRHGNEPERKDKLVWSPTAAISDVETADFLMRSWIRAVENDSTVIVFDSGNYLRFGIRHRQRQTLYISDIVEFNAEHTTPRFVKLVLAITLAAIYDATERLPLLQDPCNVGTRRKRRLSAIADEWAIKRSSKGQSDKRRNSPYSLKKLSKAVKGRDTALLFLELGIYSSPSPLYMTRCYTGIATGSTLHYSECIVIRLFEKIGDGAIGDVYRAKLELYGSSGSSDTCDEPVVVKLSRTSEGQAALEHEYSIYEHLSTLRTPLKGIPPCLGLFDGDESEQSALILGDCGQTLALRTGRYEPAVTVSNIERSGYLRILDGLHAADVLHGDLRTWNMLIDDDGQPALIDFDRARRNPSQGDIVKERARLVKLLDGFEVDDDS